MSKTKPARPIRFYMDTGKWGFLSPMYLCPVRMGGIEYRSAEHYYQSMKATDGVKRAWIRDAATGYEAKARAHSLKEGEVIRKSPEQKIATVREAFIAKFTQNQDLGARLLETGNAELLEDSPDDLFWGAKGENWIGRLVMEARERIRKQEA
jgi:ribA/ribD-fused uncharacterized protein